MVTAVTVTAAPRGPVRRWCRDGEPRDEQQTIVHGSARPRQSGGPMNDGAA
jgi:hypothetical protein